MTDDQCAVELAHNEADALLSGLKVGRLPDGTHFPSDIEAVLSFARWYASARLDQVTAEAAVLLQMAEGFDEDDRDYERVNKLGGCENNHWRTQLREFKAGKPLTTAFLAEHEKMKAERARCIAEFEKIVHEVREKYYEPVALQACGEILKRTREMKP